MQPTNTDYRVVICIPSGRRRYLEVLLPYILRERGIIDQVNLWVNTNNIQDIEYISCVCKKHPEFFKSISMPDLKQNSHAIGKVRGVCKFYNQCVEPHTVYIKCDDDICYIEKDAIKELVAFRLENQEPLLVYPNIINNVMLSHIHQRFGCIPVTIGACRWNPFCAVGRKSGAAAAAIHNAFLRSYHNHSLDNYRFSRFVLWDYVRVSIGLVVFFGEDMSAFNGVIEGIDDERFLSEILPARLKRPNVIYGKKLVSHFSYGTQRAYLEANTDLLSRYKQIMMTEVVYSQML